MNQCYLDSLTNHTKKGKVPYNDGLNLDESCGHVIPDVNQIQYSVSDKLT